MSGILSFFFLLIYTNYDKILNTKASDSSNAPLMNFYGASDHMNVFGVIKI